MTNRFIGRAAAAALVALAAPAAAQAPLTARSVGAAGSAVADARGVDALFFNPANLALSGSPAWSVSIPQAAVRTGFVGTRLGQVPSMLHFNRWSQGEKDAFLGGIPAEGLNARVDLTVPVAAVQVRGFALGVSFTESYSQNLGRDVADLLVNGYQNGRTNYAVGNTSGRNASWLDFSGAYGRRVGKVSVGVAAHYVAGRSLAQQRLFEPSFDLEAQDISAELREVSAHGGRGWGVDLGVAAQPSPRLTLSAAVSNALSGMKWSTGLRTKSLVLSRGDFSRTGAIEARTRFDRSEAALDPQAVPLSVYETAQGLYDGAWLPATLRVGAAYLATPRTHLTAAYQGALDNGTLSGGWRRQLSGGVEHGVGRLLALRAGAGTDVGGAWMLSGGAGLGPLQVGVARTSEPRGSARSSGWTFALGFTARGGVPVR
ncbi:MAG TPA: DUF5723 family protein [Longimicrobium sp.]|nr:DUF5723 family protein [Longimicrobium sp.]